MKPVCRAWLWVALVASTLGCSSIGGGFNDQPERTHYTLEVGDQVPSHDPLPDLTKIKVDWHYSDGSSRVVDGYRGWDFDGDQRYDMVEMLGDNGAIEKRVFDFDGDGRIDLVK